MLNIINLTPHTVRVIGTDGTISAEYPSQGSCRVQTSYTEIANINGFPVLKTSYGITDGLPPEDGDGTVYIVSMVVQQANPDRTDLVCPNTAPDQTVRDENGQIFGVRSFAIYA